MTQDMFTSWLCKFGEDMVAEKMHTLDNCTARNIKPKLTTVNLKFLPANMTPKCQHLNQSVIVTVKLQESFAEHAAAAAAAAS
ncbi:hypothetical protein HPB50_017070 [Hyalomma asiaticum]|uniref:Uncharacterized protein n=1 Tax=Hyalomma asiaticum TaxID=266040 RepID=A0ACB7SNX7_HYAAI|nr:hypothetical protein HPB50_017070 [Hyalomma asiaticum]